jgi:hypothetical protein
VLAPAQVLELEPVRDTADNEHAFQQTAHPPSAVFRISDIEIPESWDYQ